MLAYYLVLPAAVALRYVLPVYLLSYNEEHINYIVPMSLYNTNMVWIRE